MPLSPGAITGIVIGSVMGGVLLATGSYVGVSYYKFGSAFKRRSSALNDRIINMNLPDSSQDVLVYFEIGYRTSSGNIVMGHWACADSDKVDEIGNDDILQIFNDAGANIERVDTQVNPKAPDFKITLSSKDKFDAIFN